MGDRTLTRLTATEILAGLSQALLAERQAVADYGAHAQASTQPDIREALEMLRDVEAEHATRLTVRIAALGGTPTSQVAEPRGAGHTLESRLLSDLKGEQWAIVEYARLVAGIVDDDETVDLMTELLLDEIRHACWLKSALRTHQADSPTG